MQQTDKYKLNLIERADTFSPDALNENTQKVEEVLAGEEAARKQKDAYLEGKTDGLDARVTALEVQKIYFGSYVGTGGQRTINLGVTPLAVLVHKVDTSNTAIVLNQSIAGTSGGGSYGAAVCPDGFYFPYSNTVSLYNQSGHIYYYIAFL